MNDFGPDFSEALARGLTIITAFTDQRRQMSLSDVARVVDLPKATVRRAIFTLQHLGYVEADGRLFRLSPSILKLAHAYLTSNAVSTILQPACEALTRACGESCTAAVLEGRDVVMIARALPSQAMPVGAGIGFRLAAYSSALGRTMLASRPDAEIDAYLSTVELVQDTPHTIVAPARLRQELLRVRAQGYSYADQEAELGFRSIAVPLRKFDDTIVAALNIGARVERVSGERMTTEFRSLLQQTADDLRRQLV